MILPPYISKVIRVCLAAVVIIFVCFVGAILENHLLPDAFALGPGSGLPIYNDTHGKVFRRGVVLDKDQRAYFARYGSTGEVLEVIPSSSDKMDEYVGAFVMPREEFLDEQTHMNEKAINGRLVQTRKEYESMDFKTILDATIDFKPPLKPSTNSVLIRAPEEFYLSSILPIIEEYRISKDGAGTDLKDKTVSLMIDQYGDVMKQYDDPVAFLTSYKKADISLEDLSQYSSVILSRTDSVLRPLQSVHVSSPYALGRATTDNYGDYRLSQRFPACPGTHYSEKYDVWAEIPYLAARPVAGRPVSYIYVTPSRRLVAACSDNAEMAFSSHQLNGMIAGMSASITEQDSALNVRLGNLVRDIPVSLFVLRGHVGISNQVELYSEVDYLPQPEIIHDDLKTSYIDRYTNTEGSVDFYSQSLLEKITLEDFRKTDVYVFRDSTGELVSELINGESMAFDFFDEAKTKHRLLYAIVVPAFDQHSLLKYGAERETGVQFGEKLDVVIINRATGYLSMQVVKAEPEADGIEVVVGITMMRPPNLKIHVVRDFYTLVRPDTLQAIDSSNIAFEGSGLTSDKTVVLKTDWRDQSGRLLPAELPGYTGRITMVVDKDGTSELAGKETEGVEQFAINPNEHYQLITLPTPTAPSREHFYVHVNGESTTSTGTSQASFETDSEMTGIMQYRPKYTVPILVQVADIYASNELKRVLIDNDRADNYQPLYRWVYRPEAQYTLFDFYANNIIPLDPYAVDPYAGSMPAGTQIIDLTADATLLKFAQDAYAMFGPLSDLTDPYSYLMSLERFGTTSREFSFQLRDAYGDPIAVNIDQYGIASISDPYGLDAADFTLISLFQNDDPENILWSLGNTIILTTSDDPYSNRVRSFIVDDYSTPKTAQRPSPIKAELFGQVRNEINTTIEWKIEAIKGNMDVDDQPGSFSNKNNKPFAYGGVKEVSLDPKVTVTAISLDSSGAIIEGLNDGSYSHPWISKQLPVKTGRNIEFRPAPLPHYPNSYTKKKGTTKIDVYRHNPRLAYKVTATLTTDGAPKIVGSMIARMDDIDMIRQEYINHLISAPSASTEYPSGKNNAITVPDRFRFKSIESIGDVVLVEKNDYLYKSPKEYKYAYSYLLEEGMYDMWIAYEKAFNSDSSAFPSGSTMKINSGYRNPERQEFFSKAIRSMHMAGGRALDIGASNIGTSTRRGAAFVKIWNVINKQQASPSQAKSASVPTADFWQLEDINSYAVLTSSGGFMPGNDYDLDANGNGILDGYEATYHLHMQNNPD